MDYIQRREIENNDRQHDRNDGEDAPINAPPGKQREGKNGELAM